MPVTAGVATTRLAGSGQGEQSLHRRRRLQVPPVFVSCHVETASGGVVGDEGRVGSSTVIDTTLPLGSMRSSTPASKPVGSVDTRVTPGAGPRAEATFQAASRQSQTSSRVTRSAASRSGRLTQPTSATAPRPPSTTGREPPSSVGSASTSAVPVAALTYAKPAPRALRATTRTRAMPAPRTAARSRSAGSRASRTMRRSPCFVTSAARSSCGAPPSTTVKCSGTTWRSSTPTRSAGRSGMGLASTLPLDATANASVGLVAFRCVDTQVRPVCRGSSLGSWPTKVVGLPSTSGCSTWPLPASALKSGRVAAPSKRGPSLT